MEHSFASLVEDAPLIYMYTESHNKWLKLKANIFTAQGHVVQRLVKFNPGLGTYLSSSFVSKEIFMVLIEYC